MRIPRIYQASPLDVGQQVQLDDDAFGHVVRVLRMGKGEQIYLFNNTPAHFLATLDDVSKKHATVTILEKIASSNESCLNIHLGQVISRGDKMEFTIQKAVELGVNTITPLFSERCGVKLTKERLDKKVQQWQKVVISACEQSGRDIIPVIRPVMQLEAWCSEPTTALKLNLHPRASHGIKGIQLPEDKRIRLLIGPEGGLSQQEIDNTAQHQFTDILLGPRVLRTETAALTAISALQSQFGDLG